MKIKMALLGLVAATVCVAPVIAHGGSSSGGNSHAGRGTAHGTNQHVEGTGFVCTFEDDFIGLGGVARWVSNHGWVFRFGTTDVATDDTVGLRLEAANQPARNFGADWDLYYASEPYIAIYFSDGYGIGLWDFYYVGDITSGSEPGFTAVNLKNDVWRIKYNAQADGMDPSYKFNNIYLFDGDNDYSGLQTLSNVYVNNVSVVPNTNPMPQVDCTVDYSFGS